MKKFNIIASVAKIENKNAKENLNVIGSFVKYNNDIDLDSLNKTSDLISQYTDFFAENKFIVLYLNYWDKNYENMPLLSLQNKNVKIVHMNVFSLIHSIRSGKTYSLFNDLNTKNEIDEVYLTKDESVLFQLNNLLLRDNMKYQNVILIFENITLSNLYILFKNLGIAIYGGNSQRRHLLSTVHKSLVMFLQLLNNMSVSSNMIYESYIDVEMSKSKNVNKLVRLMDNVIYSKNPEEVQKNILILDEYSKLQSEDYLHILKFNKMLEVYLEISNAFFVIKKNNNELIYLNEKVANQRGQIKNLKLEITENEDRIRYFSGLLYALYEEYFNDKGEFIYDTDIKIDLNDVKSSLDVKIQSSKINTINQKREYSTLVRNNPCHSIRRYNIFNKNKRYLNTNNTIVSGKIMELLYSNINKEDIQRNIEKYLINEQNIFILNKVSSTPIDYSLFSSDLSNRIMESIPNLSNLYKNYLKKDDKFKKILSEVNFNFIVNIVLGRLLTIISNNNRANKFTFFTEVAYDFGKELVNKYNYIQYKSNKSYKSMSLFIEENPDKIISVSDVTSLVELGCILIGWLIELKLISTRIEVMDKKEKRKILMVGDLIKDIILKEEAEVGGLKNLPLKLPMIVPPKKIKKIKGQISLGGYLLNDEEYIEPLIIDNPQLVSKSEIDKKNIIYDMINYINSVAFNINVEVLDFVLKYYKKYNLIIDFEYKHPLTLKKKLNIYEKKELESFLSKKNLEIEILNIANIFRNIDELYFPVRLDYRGRMYCMVDYLNYQGIELAKALLKFSTGDVVSLKDELSFKYLKIYGANCWGNKLEKESFVERIKWVDSNKEDIINFENGKLLSKAENKLLFIAFCFEYKKYIKAVENNDKYFISHLPVQLDATSNGFQHLSLLLKDSTLAKRVNLDTSSWNDKPDDFYSFLSLKIKQYFIEDLKNNKELKKETLESYQRLVSLDFQNHRNLVKKTIMTIPYNATIYSNIQRMKDEFKYDHKSKDYVLIKDNNIIFKENDFKVICNTLYTCLYRDFPKLNTLFYYLKSIGHIANTLKLHIPWCLPTGLIVKQKFKGNKKLRLKPFIFTKDLLNLNIYDKESTNNFKQIRALMPNLIHSLDAASLSLLIYRFFKIGKSKNFYAVHDCFGVTCNNVHLISELLKLIYVDIYCNNQFLRNFDENFKKTIKDQYGQDSFINGNKIEIINELEEVTELSYPDINDFFKPEVLNFKTSSYTVN